MDLKNLSGAASGLGDKLPGMGGQGADGMMGKLFPDTGRKTSEEEFGKMQECAKMLEKYVTRVPKESGCINMDSPDAERWRNDFFKNLVHGGPELLDDQFYTGDKTAKSNMGIGTDCSFSCEELFQFLYRLYKAMASYKVLSAGMAAVAQNTDLFGCAEMLEKYVDRFPKTKGCVKFEGQDASDWKDRYFPNLVEGGPKLPDYAFFNASNKNYGIGLDCSFHARELFQFLYRLYKEIVNRLG